MDHFAYRDGQLYAEDVPVAELAEQFGTPLFVYSAATLRHHYTQVADAFAELSPTICYSIKSNGNLHVCRLLAKMGCGFDVTSGGELFRALQAGGEGRNIIYAGVGKTDEEIAFALRSNIAAFNIESEAEVENIDRITGELGKQAVGAVRINPDVDPKTHAYTTTGKKESKFGVDLERAEKLFDTFRYLKHLRIAGVHMHLGSPIYETQPYVDAVKKINTLIDRLTERGHKIEWFDLGGGYGVNYRAPDQAPSIKAFADALLPHLRGRDYKVALEPGRYIAGNAGVMLTRVLYRKQGGKKRFVIVDAGMNDLLRPSLYDAYHFIWPTNQPPSVRGEAAVAEDGETVDIVGPVCETGDFLARDRHLPVTARGDLLAVYTTGAYGFAMSSNYNHRPRAAEVLVDGADARLIRRRETYEDLVAAERV